MTHTTAIQASTSLVAQLASPAARALILACGAAIGLAVFRVKTASLRLFTWTAVLYAALAMPLLGRLLPPLPVPVPAVLQSAAAQPSVATPTRRAVAAPMPLAKSELHAYTQIANSTPSSVAVTQISTVEPTSEATWHEYALSTMRWNSIPWTAVATGIYFAVALLLLLRVVIGMVLAQRLMRASQTIHDPRVTESLTSRANACGLAVVPPAAESDFISVPVTMGALRSTILLPADWREWDDAKLDAVVAHEMSHVARRDALTQRLSLVHRAIFWFSPLAWWLDRHLADLAEQASDEAALSFGADQNAYARTLLGFFEALHTAPGRVWWQGVSMAKAGQAEKRLERILAWRGAVTMSLKKSELKKSFAAAIIALAIPVIYLAASVHPASAQQSGQSAAPAATSAAPATPRGAPALIAPAEESTSVEEVTDQSDAPDPALAPVAPALPAAPIGGVTKIGPVTTAPVAAIAPVAPVLSWSSRSHNHGYSYAYGDDDDERFVIVSGKSDSLTMSGSTQDARHVEKLRKQIPGDFIWFQRDEKSYIIRDQATIDRAKKLWAPQEELGKKQEALGKQQEVLGKQQEALGKRMEEIHVQVPDMSAEIDKLKAELKQLSSGATVEQVGRIQSEIGDLQSRIGEIQSHAGDQQSKLGEEMGALGEKQGKLGEQQGELGRQQGELAEKATRDMKVLLDEAIKNGTAKPEAETGGTASL